MKEFTFFVIGAVSMFIITEFGYGWATAFTVVALSAALVGFAASNKACS
jgi:hypothetical protein